MKLLLPLLVVAVAAFVLLWPDSDSRMQSVSPEPFVEVEVATPQPSPPGAEAPERTELEPESALEVPITEVDSTAAFLASVPFEQRPRLANEHLPGVTGVSPPWELVAPVMEWNIRTCVGQSYEKVLDWARARVMPQRFRSLVERDAVNYEEALAVYDSYQPMFTQLANDWAVAELRYRKEVWERGLYERWTVNEEAPPGTGSGQIQENITSYGWTVSFTYVPGVCPEYDAVIASNRALQRELEQSLFALGVLDEDELRY